MSAFDDAAEALHSDPNLSRAATYYAAGAGAGVPVSIIWSEPQREDPLGDVGKVVREIKADVRLVEVAKPTRGDTLQVGDCLYEVTTVLADELNITAALTLCRKSKSGA